MYDALVEPELFRQWFGVTMEIEPAVGGRWAMGGFHLENSVARIVELVPGKKVVLDWGALVETWELAGSAGRTYFTFVQSGFDDEHPPYAKWMGWLARVGELRRFHELPDWRPTVLQHEIPGTPREILVPHLHRSADRRRGSARLTQPNGQER
ncbi:activator of Hsp90 ATPase-like protein [Prauserella shujinwangii]|uniref:Activator of Hsp90 ATPase-like protein n=1 Tax=Prauserella shujinwangii TaxID=1453103 RepID=A0A2T0M2W9_9PSEU|nr:SRPBCC domain-containing protein [Prauserella shujinwangii]PRX51088.1 activator of Hsp90 ATPase-like protein [Prauserella shujinwangii]